MSVLLKNAVHDGDVVDILIEGKLITKIGNGLSEKADEVIDATDMAVLPSFVNAHNHAAMTLLRGYGDDMELMDWLQNKIWPLEAKLTEEDVYWGTKLACLEMIKSGTTSFVDMYWHFPGCAKAVDEMGMKALISGVFIDMFDPKQAQKKRELNEALYFSMDKYSERITYCLGPHAIYTVSEESLRWIREFADKHKVPITIHLSETVIEVQQCLDKYGCRPVEFLDKIGFLGPDVIVAHCIHLTDNEIEILKKYKVIIAHNPTSNMKLCPGVMPYQKLKDAGLTIALGTDGCSSNNNLDMLDEMKIMALLHKNTTLDPKIASADEVYQSATEPLTKSFFRNSGEIAVGKNADLILVNLNHHRLIPNHNLTSNLVYSANGDCVDTVICDGRILMKHRHIDEEEEIIQRAKKAVNRLLKS
ncbi:MAG: amidohydrolase [Candidatus Zophobacter franzmannii]|nr:amidohydrolase [Candidatus Zophobacter franzmannii]